jgi:hypothetical protein
MGLSFNGSTKIITLSTGTVSVSVRDLWSRWVDWLLTSDNSKYQIAMSQVGGDDIDLTAGTKIPIYIFLQNGWKLKPQEASHTLNIGDGILLVDGGGDPFVNTTGSYVVRVNYQQPVQAISFSSTGATAVDPWAAEMETGKTYEAAMRLMSAILLGKVSGAGTGAEVFRDINDSKDRVAATVDSNGNRTAIILDAT